MYTLRRLLLSDHIRCHLKDAFLYSTKAKHVKHRRQNRNLINPGIYHTTRLLKENPADEVEDLDFDDLDDFESDFTNAGVTYKEHLAELEARKERQKNLIVKQKYFKEKLPNFLTWNDKQQIKFLHRTDPEQWTIEKLSESFPALPEAIAVSRD